MTIVYECKGFRHPTLTIDLNAYSSKSNTAYQIVMATHLVINNRIMHIYKTWGNYKTNIMSIKDVYSNPKTMLKGAVCKLVHFGNQFM